MTAHPQLRAEVREWLAESPVGGWHQQELRVQAESTWIKNAAGTPLVTEISAWVIRFERVEDEVMFRLRWTGA